LAAGWASSRISSGRATPLTRYGLFNSLGVIVEDAIVVAILIFGGILDACPDLKVCIAHGGGPACFAMGRIDRGSQARPEARPHIQQPPSAYQRRLYYGSVTGSEEALRFRLDQVGADRVVLGGGGGVSRSYAPLSRSAVEMV